MDNKFKSLAQQLVQNGILSQDSIDSSEIENIYGIEFDENMTNSPFEKKEEDNAPTEQTQNRKRINRYDMELVNQDEESSYKIAKRFLNLFDFHGKISFKRIVLKLFPKFYKAKLAKEAIKKLDELNIDTSRLHEKNIPYGENETQYSNLVKYLNCANEIQQNLKDEFN